MKQFIILMLILGSLARASGAPTIKAKASGNWQSSSTWDLGRAPQNGDTVVITTGHTVLINNAVNLNNVFIKVYGILSLDNGAHLFLNLISAVYVYNTGSIHGGGSGDGDQIKIGGVLKFNDDPNITGPKYADQTTGVSPNGFSAMLLPVVFVNFYVARANEDIRIYWATSMEINNNHFEIERSLDGNSWSTIAIVFSAGNTGTITNYSYTDKNVKVPMAFYRIKQVDNDGRITYTAIRSVKNNDQNSSATIYVTQDKNIIIKFDQVKEKVAVKILNTNGQVIMQQSYTGTAYISFRPNNVANGIYIVQVSDEANKNEVKKVMLN